MPPPSPGQCFDVDACVRVVANTTPGVVPVRANGLLFATVVKYEGRGDYLVKGSGSDGRGSQRRVSGDFLVHQCMDGFGAMFRSDEGCGGSAARELARAADSSRKAVKRAAKRAAKEVATSVATSVATAAKTVAKVKKMANKELLRAADDSRRVEKQAAAKVAAAAKIVAKAEKKAMAVRVSAVCRGTSWFTNAWMASAPCFEVMKVAAAPRRGSLRVRQTLAEKR